MKKINIAFGILNHQPVGNFDFVFEEAYNKAFKYLTINSGRRERETIEAMKKEVDSLKTLVRIMTTVYGSEILTKAKEMMDKGTLTKEAFERALKLANISAALHIRAHATACMHAFFIQI